MRYAFKSRSTFSGVLGCPGLGEVGVLGSDDGEWSWLLLVGFLRLPFAIWQSLELVVIVVFVKRLFLCWFCYPLSAGVGDKLSSLSFSGQSSLCRQALLSQGRCTVIWCLDLLLAEGEGPKQDLSQKLCCFGQEGGRLSGAEDGTASEALWLLPVSENDGLCIPHPHLCCLPSVESRNLGGYRRDWGRNLSRLIFWMRSRSGLLVTESSAYLVQCVHPLTKWASTCLRSSGCL